MGAKTQNRERGTPFFFAAVEASSAARDHAEQASPRRRRRSLDLDLRGSLIHAPRRPRPGLDPLHRPGPGNARSPPRGSRPRDRRPPRGPQLRRGLRRGRGAVLWQVRLLRRRRRSRSVAPLLDGCRPGRRRRGRRPALRPGAGSAPRVPQEGRALGQAPESRGGGGSSGGGGGRGEETSWREQFFSLVVARGGGKKTQKSQNTLSTNSFPPPESHPRGALQPRGHLLRRRRAPVPLRRHGVQAGALRERHWRRGRRRRSLAAAAAGRRRLGRRRRRRARVFRPRRRRRRPRPPPPLRIHAGRTRGSLRGSWPSREGPGPRRGRAAGRTGVLQAAAGAARGAAAAAAAAAAGGGGCSRGPRRPRRARPLPLPRPLLHRNGLRPLSGSRVVVGPRRGVHGARGARARLGDAGARPGLGRGARVPAR